MNSIFRAFTYFFLRTVTQVQYRNIVVVLNNEANSCYFFKQRNIYFFYFPINSMQHSIFNWVQKTASDVDVSTL